jgi:hypothetical protein
VSRPADTFSRHLLQALAVLAIVVVALAVFAWQQSGGDGAVGPLNAIAQAAVKTEHEGGGRAAVRGIVSKPGLSKPLTFTGQAVYDDAGMARGAITMADPKSSGSVKFEYVQDGTEMYMRSSRLGTLPEGREWMGLDLSFGEELDTSLPANGDVKGGLEMLEKATGGVDKVGKEDVRGVPTTRYRGEVSVSENAKRLREVRAQKTASYVEKLASPLQLEAWIDAKGLVRRMRIVQLKPGEDGTTIDMRTDFFDFGFEPEIDVPDSSEVFDATPQVQEQLDASSDE